MQNKESLRKSAKILRKSLDIKKISEEILQIFCASEYYKNAKNIALYYPYGSELDLRKLFVDVSKRFFLPKTNNDGEMSFVEYQGAEKLEKGFSGIFEPIGCEINPELIDLMIIPALMADSRGFRLGYGKGCYDKFLRKHNLSCLKIVCVPESLFVDEMPVDDFDVPVDIIFTESGFVFI